MDLREKIKAVAFAIINDADDLSLEDDAEKIADAILQIPAIKEALEYQRANAAILDFVQFTGKLPPSA